MNDSAVASRVRPTLQDRIERLMLRAAKFHGQSYSAAESAHAAFYERFFSEKNLHECLHDLRQKIRQEAVSTALGDITGDAGSAPVVVDIGCGPANIIAGAAQNCLRVGVAYATRDVELSRTVNNGGIRMMRGSVLELPFRPQAIDVAIFLEVMEHLHDDGAALSEIARVLKEGGRLIVSVPSSFYYSDYLKLMGHYRHYSRHDLVRKLNRHGFEVSFDVDTHPTIQVLHYYLFIALSVVHHALNHCGFVYDSLYVRPTLGRLYCAIASGLAFMKKERDQDRLRQDPRSTFVVATKTA